MSLVFLITCYWRGLDFGSQFDRAKSRSLSNKYLQFSFRISRIILRKA